MPEPIPPRVPQESFMKRHPVATGALIGAGVATVIVAPAAAYIADQYQKDKIQYGLAPPIEPNGLSTGYGGY